MEFFNKAEAVILRSHLKKYLIADQDRETVRQSRTGSTREAKWEVERVEGKNDVIRLRGCYGGYLTATDHPFLVSMKKISQTRVESGSDLKTEWEPVRVGFQVKLRCWSGTYLKANGGTPPWRNSVSHDESHGGSTRNWVLWDVEEAEITDSESVSDYLSALSSFSAGHDETPDRKSKPGSPVTTVQVHLRRLSFAAHRIPSLLSPKRTIRSNSVVPISQKLKSGMELFHNVKMVHLRSHHNKYLSAEEDRESVTQRKHKFPKKTQWVVEFVPGFESFIRFRSCYGTYLTASNHHFLLGMTGFKVTQTLPNRLDSSVEWEPIREGGLVKLKTRYGNFLRANGGMPPWRNSVTHDVPHRSVTQDWVLWEVDVVESYEHCSDSLDSDSSSTSFVSVSESLSRQESSDYNYSSLHEFEGRTIYYKIADENGDVDCESLEDFVTMFRGNEVDELTKKLEEETGMEGIVVCTLSPLDKKLYPLSLQLPPNNASMHVVVVESSSKLARALTQ